MDNKNDFDLDSIEALEKASNDSSQLDQEAVLRPVNTEDSLNDFYSLADDDKEISKKEKLPELEKSFSIPETALRHAAEGITSGLSGELYSLGKVARDGLSKAVTESGGDPLEMIKRLKNEYDSTVKLHEMENAASSKENPTTAMLSDIAGGVAQNFAIPGSGPLRTSADIATNLYGRGGRTEDMSLTDVGLGGLVAAAGGMAHKGLSGITKAVVDSDAFKTGKEFAEKGIDLTKESLTKLGSEAFDHFKNAMVNLLQGNKSAVDELIKIKNSPEFKEGVIDLSKVIDPVTSILKTRLEKSSPGNPVYEDAKNALSLIDDLFPKETRLARKVETAVANPELEMKLINLNKKLTGLDPQDPEYAIVKKAYDQVSAKLQKNPNNVAAMTKQFNLAKKLQGLPEGDKSVDIVKSLINKTEDKLTTPTTEMIPEIVSDARNISLPAYEGADVQSLGKATPIEIMGDLPKQIKDYVESTAMNGSLKGANKKVADTLTALEYFNIDPRILNADKLKSGIISDPGTVDKITSMIKTRLSKLDVNDAKAKQEAMVALNEILSSVPELAPTILKEIDQAYNKANMFSKGTKVLSGEKVEIPTSASEALNFTKNMFSPTIAGVAKKTVEYPKTTAAVKASADIAGKAIPQSIAKIQSKTIDIEDGVPGRRVSDLSNDELKSTLQEASKALGQDVELMKDINLLDQAINTNDISAKNRLIFKLQQNVKFRNFLKEIKSFKEPG